MAMVGCTEPAPQPPGDPTPVYLALGDSIAYGYDPLTAGRMTDGYPEVIAQRMGIEVANASCPGEATGGFISVEGNDNHCRENKLEYGLHVDYQGTQLAYAVDYLAAHPGTELVTIDIGGNDASKLNDLCAGVTACVLGGFVGMLTDYGTNLDIILGEIRKVYDGPLVGLAVYNPYPTDLIAQYGLERLNVVLAEKLERWDGVFADGMAAFHAASGGDPCASGLLIRMPDGSCDVHPSPAGDTVLADSIDTAMGR
jgi:lysophospholipase L1-like esterase